MALKEEKYHHMPVYMWPDKDVRDRKPAALEQVTAELRDEVDFRIFLQYIFFKQWTALRQMPTKRAFRSSVTSRFTFPPTRPMYGHTPSCSS